MQVHLIRHGEVDNPDDVVYANIPGFVLSAKGRAQATAAGRRLAGMNIERIIASPLDRAVETAQLIAAETGAIIATDPRLTEWGLGVRWRGAVWHRLPLAFPGELEAYLADPYSLPFCDESLAAVAARMTESVNEWSRTATADLVFVSHEDPIHAAHLQLTSTAPQVFHGDKPTHCSITTIERSAAGWVTTARWNPER